MSKKTPKDRTRKQKPAAGVKKGAKKAGGCLASLFKLIPAFLVLGLVLWVVVFVVFVPELPSSGELRQSASQAKITVLAQDGSILAERGTRGQSYVTLNEISPNLEAAVLATEDRRFYKHFGLDFLGTGRAILSNINSRRLVAGGSTITQQLAKNLFLTPERSLTRKLRELILAVWLETQLSKQEILELYLNRVYFGAGVYGVEAAAQFYFDVPAADLNLAQSAMIAGLLKAPSRFAPTNNLKRAQDRAATVARLMSDAGYITPEDAKKIQDNPATLSQGPSRLSTRYFVDHLLDETTEVLGKPEQDWVISSTLNPSLQRAAEEAVARHLKGRPELQAALVLLDKDGALRAMVGGRSRDSFNRATKALRQPGSAFKPFVFASVVERGFSGADVITDEPFSVDGWQPRNAGGQYFGKIRIDEAFARSLNTVAVKLSEISGRDAVVELAQRFGLETDLKNVPSLPLGTSETTVLELTGSYLPFANKGVLAEPHGFTRVIDGRGKVLVDLQPEFKVVFRESDAKRMEEMFLLAVGEGSARRAAIAGRKVYGKTGTTQRSRDAWFVGFSGGYTAGVWVGRDDNRPMENVSGGSLPALIWRDLISATPKPDKEAPLPVVRPSQKDPTIFSSVRDFFRNLAGD